MITLTWWVLAGALLLAAMVGGMCVALLFALADDPKRTPLMDDYTWEDEHEDS